MPGLVKHKEQIASNERFFTRINENDPKFYDWNLTVMFYTIVHYSDALFAIEGHKKVKDHRNRLELAEVFFTPEEFAKYRHLKSASEESRYEVGYLGRGAQQRCIHIHQNVFSPLKQSLESKIASR